MNIKKQSRSATMNIKLPVMARGTIPRFSGEVDSALTSNCSAIHHQQNSASSQPVALWPLCPAGRKTSA